MEVGQTPRCYADRQRLRCSFTVDRRIRSQHHPSVRRGRHVCTHILLTFTLHVQRCCPSEGSTARRSPRAPLLLSVRSAIVLSANALLILLGSPHNDVPLATVKESPVLQREGATENSFEKSGNPVPTMEGKLPLWAASSAFN